ncbi:hypothetical protein A3F64_03250 [Candidatus Saccharibacteria bacterium RIFCSPHIGHO2_12_FULL_42_8]|nr:MAG: hypothetical protein A3F64_03250 [Candidatus Saccharibacteria bacterium RIFCSPHIGHO2_12_FULL_42_8]
MKNTKLLLGIALLSVVLLSAVNAPSASAKLVNACGSGFCIEVDTRGKNYTNRTEYVSNIYVFFGLGNVVEAWGDGFYKKASGQKAFWWINRWVRSGTYVCGATNVYGSSGRKIACIVIRV